MTIYYSLYIELERYERKLQSLFIEYLDVESDQGLTVFCCPGRANLLGEHINYNGGWVLSTAISMGIYAAMSVTTNRCIWLQPYLINGWSCISINPFITWRKTTRQIIQRCNARTPVVRNLTQRL